MQPLASWIESLRPIWVLRRSQRKYRSDSLWWLATEDPVYCLFCLLQKLRVPFIAVLVSESAGDPFHPTILILHQYATVFSFRRTAWLALWHSTGRMRFGHLRIGDELPGLFLDVLTCLNCRAFVCCNGTTTRAVFSSEAGTAGTGSYNGESEVSKTIPGERRTGRVGRAMQSHAGPICWAGGCFCTLKNRFFCFTDPQPSNLQMDQCSFAAWSLLIIIDLQYWQYYTILTYKTYHYLPHHLLTYNWATKKTSMYCLCKGVVLHHFREREMLGRERSRK